MYLLACIVVMGFAVFLWPRTFAGPDAGLRERRADFHKYVGLVFLPACLMAAPVIGTLVDVMLLGSGASVSPSRGTVSIVLGMVGAAVVLLVAVARGIQRRQQPGFWFVGWLLASVLAAGVALVATASQLLFVSLGESGMVAFGYFRDQVKDMPDCDADTILARWDRSGASPVVYRCPKAYLFNPLASAPFVPWPDYTEGSSADLAAALHKVMDNAEKME